MNAIISRIKAIIKAAFNGKVIASLVAAVTNYALHVALVFLAAVALHFGWHISVPVLPTALGSMTGVGVLRWLVHTLAKQYHLGRIEAEAEKTVENFLAHEFGSFINEIGKLGGEEPRFPAKANGANGGSSPQATHLGAYL